MNIENALRHLLPNPQFYGRLVTPEDYAEITWVDPRPKPTWDEIVSAYQTVVDEREAKQASVTAELAAENAIRQKHGLAQLKTATFGELEQTVADLLASEKSAKKAIEMLAVAVALLDRRMTRGGL